MLKLRHILFVVFLALAPSLALAGPMHSAAAPSKYGFLPVAAEIGQQLQELVTGDPNGEIELKETFGTRALGFLLNSVKIIGTEGTGFISNFAALPQLTTWFDKQLSDPILLDRWKEIGQSLLLVLGGALLAGWLADALFLSLRRRINQKTYSTMSARVAAISTWFFLSLIPVIVFIGMALAIVDYVNPAKLSRFIVMTVIYALALLRLIRVGTRFFLSPRIPALRLLPFSTEQAFYVQKWIRTYSVVLVFGYFVAEIAAIVKVPAAAISGFFSIIALIIVGMTIVVIMQKRSMVSTFLRGDLSAARAKNSLMDYSRLWLARTWHVLAISYLVIGYAVTMLGAEGGFTLMLQGTIGTLLTLFLMRLAFYMSAKLTHRKKGEEKSIGFLRPILRLVIRFLAWVFGAASVAASWGVDVSAIVAGPLGQRVVGSGVTIISTVLVLAFAYEMIRGFVDRRLHPVNSKGEPVEASARVKTLLPMLNYASMFVLSLIGGMVILSELGVNTGPLLAGAGVLGVAVGFGSQTLVKDFLTGLFIIMEESISIGDAVEIGDNKGVVESMTMRTVRLRDAQGSLHIMPFSEITRIINASKGFAFALMDIGVSYDCNLEQAMQVMKKVGDDMRHDPVFGALILDNTEILGIEQFADSSITIRCRIKTIGGKQWDVRRAYMLRLKHSFDREGIEIPFPHRVVYHRRENGVTEAEAKAAVDGGE